MANPAAGDLLAGGLVPSLAGAAWTWLLAFTLGAALLGRSRTRGVDRADDVLAWGVVGMASFSVVVMLLGVPGWIGPKSVLALSAVLTVGAAAIAWARGCFASERGVAGPGASEDARTLAAPTDAGATTADPPPSATIEGSLVDRALRWTALALLSLFMAGVARFALWPTIFYDDLVYHLGSPRQALLTGTWPAMPGMHYSFMPAGWDAAYVLSFAMGGGRGPQFMNVVCLGLLVWACIRLARRGATAGASAAAAAIFAIASMTFSLGAFAGNDLFVALALVVALLRVVASTGEESIRAGIIAGAAWSAKYAALPAVAGIGFAAALVRRGSVARRSLALVAVGVAAVAVAAPWNARAFVLTGNPLYPAFYDALGGEPWSEESATLVANEVAKGGFRARGVAAFALAIKDVMLRSHHLGYPSGINGAFVALGLLGLLFARRVPDARAFGAVLAVAYAGWCLTSLNLRYAIVILAVLVPFAAALLDAVLARLGTLARTRLAAGVAALVLALVCAGPLVTAVQRHAGHYERQLGGTDALRARIAIENLPLASASAWMARELPADARILLIGDGCYGHLPRPASASSAYDRPDIARAVATARTVGDVSDALAGYTHVVINYGELDRFRRQYEFDRWFTPDSWALVGRWVNESLEPIHRNEFVTVFRVRHP